jgi:uncharacterized protein (TIGR01244 family)
MALTITKISNEYSTSPQITPEDLTEIVKLGYKTIINNRPDNEGGAVQPTSDAIKLAAEKVGLTYFYIPVIPNNIQLQEIEAFTQAFTSAAKPILGFCRTGNRAGRMLELSNSPQK